MRGGEILPLKLLFLPSNDLMTRFESSRASGQPAILGKATTDTGAKSKEHGAFFRIKAGFIKSGKVGIIFEIDWTSEELTDSFVERGVFPIAIAEPNWAVSLDDARNGNDDIFWLINDGKLKLSK